MIQCANIGKSTLKALTEKYGISESTLKTIIHKYWIQNGTEDFFPSDIYINAELGKGQYLETSNAVREVWEKHYNKPQILESEELKVAKETAFKYFPKSAVQVYEDNNGKYVLVVKEPVKELSNSIKVLSDNSTYSTQDYADYKLVTGKNAEEEPVESKSKPQTFTFEDGTTVQAPFRLNYQQEGALNAMDEFVKSNRNVMTLSGYAGTGKTSIMEMLAQKMKKQHKNIVFSASTNKAAAVLRDRVKKAGFTAQTLNKVFGISVEVDESKPYDASNLVVKLKNANITPGTVVVIDEASMINEENYKIINDIAKQFGLKIIYVGDEAQLAPVKESKISKVFRDSMNDIRRLTIVERTEDNAILKEATAIRNGKALSGESSFNAEGKGVAYVKPTNKETIRSIVDRFVPQLKKNPDYFRILAYTNNAVARYNDAVRNKLGYTDNTPRVGEPIVGYSNWGYLAGKGSDAAYRFINSESYTITKVGKTDTVHITLEDGTNIPMQATEVTIADAMGNEDTIKLMDIRHNEANRQNAVILAKEKARYWSMANRVGGQAAIAYRRKANKIDEFLFVNDVITDPTRKDKNGNPVRLQNKVFDFGYAMTAHKSQGSTFTHVLIDDVDIQTAKNRRSMDFGDIVPLDDISNMTTPDMSADMMSNEEEVDLEGTLFSEPASTPKTTSANIRQQLEYVAVSRATDTVTIISNDVKKEDSPLNHVKSSTDSTPSAVPQPVAIENTSKPTDQMNKRELWEHLKSLAEPMGERPVSYTPIGKTRQEYVVKDGKVYNKKGEEVHYQGKDINRILANLAIAEDRGVVVTYRDKDYVVDNHQTITSVTSGDIMKWGPENGDRKAIIQLAEQKFKTLIENRQNRLSEMVPELMDLLKAQGINVNDKAAMEKFLKENPQWSTKIQQAIEENREMQDIKTKTIADNTFMKAPNGKPTNLTERQWLQVRTKNFINWFGDWINDPTNASKVVDENGEPKVMLRTDDAGKTIMGRGDGGAFFATDNLLVAGSYASDEADLYKGFVNLKNPYIVKGESHGFFFEYKGKKTTVQEAQPSLIQDGYDGVYFERTWDVGDYADVEPEDDYWANNVAMFSPNQIKSATDNNGIFSIENDNIQMFIGKKARTQFEQQLMKARPDMVTPEYTVDGINFIKDPFSDDFIPNKLDAATAQRLQKEGIIKEGIFSVWALTDKGKEMAQISHPEIDATLDFLHSLEDNKENTAYIKTAIRWIANRSLTLPQDHTKAYQAFELARKKHLDLQKYNTLGELITAPEMQPKKKEKVPFNPDKAKTFSNKRTVTTEGGRVFTVYDVKNTEKGQREVCRALAAHYEMSPWCLSTFTATGEPTESARKYWHEYEGVKRRIAFENGKPVAFSSDKGGTPGRQWLEIDGKELPVGLRMLNNLGQNTVDGIGKNQFSQETLDYLVKNAYVERNPAFDWVIDDDAYKLTQKGLDAIKEMSSEPELEDREAWWDMEDTHPQASLSDSIVSEYKTPEQQEQAIEAARNEALQEQYEEYLRTGFPEPVNPDQEEVSDLPFLITPEGEIYGFADPKGDLYFDEDNVSPNVQIHEYTHLWDRAVAQRNPKLWKRGVDLMKQTSLWNEVLNDANYGQKWKAMKGMTPEKMESLIASEVHSRLTGTQGEALLNRIAKEKGSKGIVNKLKQWMLDFWKELKATFSNWSDEEINNLTLDDFNKMTVRDLVDKVNLKEEQRSQQPAQQSQQQVAQTTMPSTSVEGKAPFVPHSIQMTNLAKETGENLIQVDKEWKENELLRLDKALAEVPEDLKHNIIDMIDLIKDAVDRVPLPNYEYMNGLHEDTLVDAEWKIPILQDLDNQITKLLSSDNYKQGEEDAILEQMDRILEVADEEDLYGSLTKKQAKVVQQKLGSIGELNQKINNLYESNLIPASEVLHIAELIMNSITDDVTRLQKEPGLAKQWFPSLSTELDFQNASRKEIIETVGINRLIQAAKKNFDSSEHEYDDIETELQADLITDNWDAIVSFGTKIFAMNEGFGIKMDYKNGGYVLANGMKLGFDDLNEQQDIDSIREQVGDDQEHWQVEQRTLDILNTASETVRMAIHECYKIGKDGKPVISKWGIKERINPREAINSILSWTQGTLTIDDMVSKLMEKQIQHPWLAQLVDKLKVVEGQENPNADFQSQFFNTMCRSHQSYSIVLLDNGKYAAVPVNDHPSLTEITQSISAQFKMKQHPLFLTKGKELINLELLGNENMANAEEFNLHKGMKELRDIFGMSHDTEIGRADKKKTLSVPIFNKDTALNRLEEKPLSQEETQRAIDILSSAFKILGFSLSSFVIEQIIDSTLTSSLSSTLSAYCPIPGINFIIDESGPIFLICFSCAK